MAGASKLQSLRSMNRGTTTRGTTGTEDKVWVVRISHSWYELRIGPNSPVSHTDEIKRPAVDDNGRKTMVTMKSTIWLGGSVLFPVQANVWARFAGNNGLQQRVGDKPLEVPKALGEQIMDPGARARWFKRGHE